MRLFVALTLPDEVREQLALLEDRLPGARWVPPENYHITLRFIGEVDRVLAEDIDAELAGLAGEGFLASIAGLGSFGEGPKTRALYARVAPSEPLTRLKLKVENAMQRAGCEPEGRKFRPHVTLARFKGQSGPELKRFLVRHALFRAGPFPVADFVLVQSFLSGEGSIYREEAIYPLSRPKLAVGA